MENNREKIYDKLPVIYEFLMRKVSYQTWARYLISILKEYVPVKGRVLEIAAGNCKLANYFINYFPDITATDLSKNMLASDEKERLPKVCCDMCRLPFKVKFNLVYSTFDSVNYLRSRKSLLQMLNEVAFVLEKKGIFAFDASMEKNSIIHTKIPERKGSYNGINFIQRSAYNPETRFHTNKFKITMPNGEVFSEIHKQRIYTFETYFDLLERAGFYVVKCYESFTIKDGGPDSERLQFIAKKR